MKSKNYSLLTFLCIIIFLSGTSNLIAQNYYPLEIGNRWDYLTHYWNFGGGGGDSSYHSVEVIGDSLFPNNKQYFVLSEEDLIGGKFVRLDEHYIYYYNTYQNREDTIINFSAELNVRYFPESEIASSVELVDIDSINIFGIDTNILRFRLDGLILRYVNLSEIFGLYHLDSPGEPPGTTQWSTNAYYGIIGGEEFGNPVSVDETEHAFPTKFSLSQNYPNPFNPTTKIKFTIPVTLSGVEGSLVTLKIYDVLGNEVAILVNEELPTGEYKAEFDGTGLPSGIYIYKLTSSAFIQSKKMIFLK